MRDSDWFRFLVLEGEPQSKARPRFGRGRAYASSKQRAAEQELGYRLKRVFNEPFLKNLAVGCVFFRSNRQRIDTDNLMKHVLDSARGVIYEDDSQVTAHMGILEHDPERPRTLLVVGEHKTTMDRNLSTAALCEMCGQAFKVKAPFWRTRMRFCSQNCLTKWRGHVRQGEGNCLACGKSFRRQRAGHKYCSNECRHEGTRRVNNRAPTVCRECGSPVSRPEYRRCRSCWRKSLRRQRDGQTKQEVAEGA
ncbi:MAG: RusA family crossover junction endodeoxyribonuclease [bacterium]|nr:RusA family crossover junction endodeoxyribonuclease [bacterium]